MSRGRNGLRKQVTEAKEGHFFAQEKERGKESEPGGRGWGKAPGSRYSKQHWVLCLEGIYLEVLGRFPIEYSSAFQVCPFRVTVSTDWLVPWQGVTSAAGPGIPCLVLLLFWAWS